MPTGILSPTHLLVVLVIALLVLGPRKLPGAARSIGQGVREFKDSITGSGGGSSGQPAAALFAGSGGSEGSEGPEGAVTREPARAPAVVSHDIAPLAAGELA